MTWPIRFLERPPLHGPREESQHYDGTVDFDKLAVGDLCYYHFQGKPCLERARLEKMNLTAHYFAHNAGRPPLILAMPDAASKGPRYFMVDGQCYSNTCTRCGHLCHSSNCKCPGEWTPKGHYDGWTVTGTPPLITVHPSVDFDVEGVKHYHGFVANGVIGDG